MDKKTSNTGGYKPEKSILRRTLVLMIVCGIVAFIPLVWKLYELQVIDHDYYENLAVENQTKSTTVSASRGTIYDRNMDIMAVSASVYNIFLDPQLISETKQDVDLITNGLSSILGVDTEKIKTYAADVGTRYKTISLKVEQSVANEVREFINTYDLQGVGVEPTTKRYYPKSTLAAQIIGFVGTDNAGLNGLELKYDTYLQGTPGRIITAKSGDGTEMPYKFEQYYDATDGENLVLTIDSTIQYYLEKGLADAVEQYDVQNGAFGVIMNCKTGEILAMATLSSYDPNNYTEVSDERTLSNINALETEEERKTALSVAMNKQWRNRVVGDGYEPGSTFKTITLASALEENAVTLKTAFVCNGTTNIKGRTEELHCWKAIGHGAIDTAGALQGSCNIAFAEIGIKLTAPKLYEYVKAFGLTEPTGIDLPGEGAGVFFEYNTLVDANSYASLTSAAFGQTFKVTAIQLITAISATVNGGYLMKPYVVSQFLDSDGNVIDSNEPTVVRQVISEDTSATMRDLLESVVTKGTAGGANIAGYSIGGKTGTSEKIDEYDENGQLVDDKIVSFVGIAPMDDPEYICLIGLDTPSTKTGIYISGGQMAAPTVRNILSDILPYLNVARSYTEEEQEYIDSTIPFLTGYTEQEAKQALNEMGYSSYRVVGSGPVVTDQIPAVGAAVPMGATVVLYMGDEKPSSTVSVPNVTGLTLADATYYIENSGLYIKALGAYHATNTVVHSTYQSIDPGTDVALGTVVEVVFTDPGAID